MDRYYYTIDGETLLGPAEEATLLALLAKGSLPLTTQVCKEGFSVWRPITTIGGAAVPSIARPATPSVARTAGQPARPRLAPPKPEGFRIFGVLMLFVAFSICLTYGLGSDGATTYAAKSELAKCVDVLELISMPAFFVMGVAFTVFGYGAITWIQSKSLGTRSALFLLFLFLGIALNARVRSAPVFPATNHSYAEDNAINAIIRFQVDAQKAKGANYRPQVKALTTMVETRQMAAAEQKLAELRKAYEVMFDKNLKQYTFQSQAEFQEFSRSTAIKFEWIDWSYKECLQMQAIIAADRRDFPVALAILKSIDSVAPVSAGTAIETGYILNRMGKPETGISACRRALALSEKYASQRGYRAMALRCIGYSLIDLRQLDEAEKIFLQSLEIEPGNKVALSELASIRARRRSE